MALLYMKFITKCSGGYDGDWYDGGFDFYDEILEFSPTSGEWTVLDNLMEARWYHAVSVIKADNVIQFCS